MRENLTIYGRYFGIKRSVIRARSAQLLEFAQLEDKAEEQVEALSGGMRRRLTIARSLINEPEILLLDEPTTGLDPQARHVLWDRLFRLKQDGVTLILTTHYMDEAEQLCDRLVVMDRGRIVAARLAARLIEAHVTREVLELRFPVGEQESSAETIRSASGPVAARLGRRAARPASWSTPTTARPPSRTSTNVGLSPLTALVRRATSRTCSSSSPAARWSTDRAHLWRSFGYWMHAVPEDLARHDRDQRRQPAALPARHRRRPRRPRRHARAGAARRRVVPRVLRTRAARRGGDADRLHGGIRPGRDGGRLGRPYRAAATTPLEPSEIMGGHLLFMAFRVLTSSAAFVAVMAVFGVSDGWWALAVLPAAL